MSPRMDDPELDKLWSWIDEKFGVTPEMKDDIEEFFMHCPVCGRSVFMIGYSGKCGHCLDNNKDNIIIILPFGYIEEWIASNKKNQTPPGTMVIIYEEQTIDTDGAGGAGG